MGIMASRKYLGIIIFGILQLPLENTNGEIVRLSCNDSSASNVTSPKYPQNYDYDVNIMWNITAPSNKEIAILFQDFNTEEFDDVLGIHDPERAFNSRNYSGEHLNVPPFLSTGSYLRVTFRSDDNGDSSGFHLSLYCFDKSERTKNVRLKSSMKTNEGILEVFGSPRPQDQWIPVCPESLNSYLAGLACRQLGFPGVYQFTNETNIQYKDSTCANIVCDKSNFLLQQCVWNMTQQEPLRARSLQCFNFAYLGCYPLVENYELYLRSNDIDVDGCIHTCSMTSSELAAITRDGCYCLNVSESSIYTKYPDDSMCARIGNNIHGGDDSKKMAFHYNATIGFCEHPGDVDHGWWSSNYTHLGSTLKLSCQTGYVINGSEFIECKPNEISTKMGQDWDKTIPYCQRATETPKPTSTIGKGPLSEPSLSRLWITIITVSLSSIVAVGVMYLRYGYRKSKDRQVICGGLVKTFPRKRQETRHGDGDDISLSSNMSTSEKHLHVDSSQVHDYIDMGNIPARVSDCPNATRLRESLNFGNDATSDQRMPVNMIPTPVAVADTDVDAFGYVLPSSSASMSTMERSHLDEYGYQTLSKREESAYTELI